MRINAFIYAAVCVVGGLLPIGGSAADSLDLCDQIGAMKIDQNRVGEPLSREDYRPEDVAKACKAALEREPHNPRFRFQLAVALMALEPDEAYRHLEIAAYESSYPAAVATLVIISKNIYEMKKDE